MSLIGGLVRWLRFAARSSPKSSKDVHTTTSAIDEGGCRRCVLCRRPTAWTTKLWYTDVDEPVCGDCIAGYRLCEHGYTQVCYACGRGFDESGRVMPENGRVG